MPRLGGSSGGWTRHPPMSTTCRSSGRCSRRPRCCCSIGTPSTRSSRTPVVAPDCTGRRGLPGARGHGPDGGGALLGEEGAEYPGLRGPGRRVPSAAGRRPHGGSRGDAGAPAGVAGRALGSDVLDFSRVRHSAGREDNKIKTTTGIVASVGNWSSWPAEEVAAVREMVAGPMSALGYDSELVAASRGGARRGRGLWTRRTHPDSRTGQRSSRSRIRAVARRSARLPWPRGSGCACSPDSSRHPVSGTSSDGTSSPVSCCGPTFSSGDRPGLQRGPGGALRPGGLAPWLSLSQFSEGLTLETLTLVDNSRPCTSERSWRGDGEAAGGPRPQESDRLQPYAHHRLVAGGGIGALRRGRALEPRFRRALEPGTSPSSGAPRPPACWPPGTCWRLCCSRGSSWWWRPLPSSPDSARCSRG